MARRIVPMTMGNLKDIPQKCSGCLYWESGEKAKMGAGGKRQAILKEEWFSTTLMEWGTCGRIFYQDNEVLAYTQYAPPLYFPQIKFYSIGKPSDDAVFLSCLYVVPSVRGRGLGKILLQSIEHDLYKRNYRALETYAGRNNKENPSGTVDFYLRNGFRILRSNSTHSLVRLDFKSVVRQVNFQSVLENLKIPVQAPVPL
ncbi:MAG: GNAT family N-acetyltransferase [Actinobacteria bacterium]|nr:GNAT family N-acetyltransferase [Actinomycetota bacterium]